MAMDLKRQALRHTVTELILFETDPLAFAAGAGGSGDRITRGPSPLPADLADWSARQSAGR